MVQSKVLAAEEAKRAVLSKSGVSNQNAFGDYSGLTDLPNG